MDIEDIRGALARGYCHKGQAHKVMDPDLCEAQAQEVLAFLPEEVEAQPDDERDQLKAKLTELEKHDG